MFIPSFTTFLCALAFSYVSYSIWNVAQIFIAPKCTDPRRCLYSALNENPALNLVIYSSVKSTPKTDIDVEFVDIFRSFKYLEPFERELTINIPKSTRNNGTLYLNVLVVESGKSDSIRWSSLMGMSESVFTRVPLTQYHVPDQFIFNLLKQTPVDDNSEEEEKLRKSVKPVSHLRSQVTVNMVTEPGSLPMENIPPEIYHHLRLLKGSRYLPVVQYNFLETKIEHLKMMNNDTDTVLFKYSPIHIGKFRFIVHVEEAMKALKKIGFSTKDIDDVKNIFAGTNLYLLSATIFIVSFHLLFDFLAFKNDVRFWKGKSNMEGLSSRTVMWRAFSQAIIFFYLMDEKASMIVLIPSGIGVLIESWKVLKVVRRKNDVNRSESEKKTEEYDKESMRYLSYLLYPLCVSGAIYSLLFQPHKSWYSWSIQSLVNGVYAFGFLFMLPQLFVNYRLKSVAALPWRSFMYKAFNTFIDDVFAFLITMPAAHRMACFRDDIIFLVYLYQRWLYPVDQSRLDETARALGDKVDNDSKKTN